MKYLNTENGIRDALSVERSTQLELDSKFPRILQRSETDNGPWTPLITKPSLAELEVQLEFERRLVHEECLLRERVRKIEIELKQIEKINSRAWWPAMLWTLPTVIFSAFFTSSYLIAVPCFIFSLLGGWFIFHAARSVAL